MTNHRQSCSSANAADQAADANGDGALGTPRRRIAMTMLGSTVAACAVFGTVSSTGPLSLAADPSSAVPVAGHQPAEPTGANRQLLDGAGPALGMAAAAADPTPAVAAPAPAPHEAVVAPAPPAPAAQAPAAKKPAVHKPAAQAPVKSDPYAGESAYKVAEGIVPSSQFGCFDWVVSRESGWNVEARNPSSGAYGLGQALPGSKMASAGSDWQTNPATQIKWTLGYMDGRYGSPCSAKSFWESHGWY